MLHVAQVSGYVDPRRRSPEQLLEAWPTLRILASAAVGAGNQVTVIQAASENAVVRSDGIVIRFVRAASTRTSVRAIAAATRAVRPDIVHFAGLGYPLHVWALRRVLPDTPLLLQDHANQPFSGWRALVNRTLLRGVDGVAFTALELAEPFRSAGLLQGVRVFEVLESSSTFIPGDREVARSEAGVHGDPCVVWVGRLHEVKDPLTALDAFAGVLDHLPGARLWCAFGEAPMLEVVQRRIDRDARLACAVTLLGRVPHAHIQTLLRAADIFLATSRKEGSGYALLEALACGATPVVTRIPAFRALTTDGAIGVLFPVGDAVAGADALVSAAARAGDRARVRAHFAEHGSPHALGRQLTSVYTELVESRSGMAHRSRAEPADSARARSATSTVARPAAAMGAKTLRVCVIVPGGVDRSGTERVIPCLLALIERLARQVDVHVLALSQGEDSRYELLGATVQSMRWRGGTAPLVALLREHRRQRFDVLHAIWANPQGTIASLAGAALRIPVLLHINGGDLAAVPDIAYGGRLTAHGRRRLRVAVAGAARVTVPCEAMVAAARALHIRAERVTYGVDVQRWPVAAPRPGPVAAPARLLSVGSINRVKDHDTLLRAIALLRARGHDIRVDCVGLDTLGGAVARRAEALGIDDVIRFPGFVTHAALRSYYDAADLLVVSSRSEGDPIAALEAAVAGVPVVGTAVGHLHEWAPDAALVCTPGDAESLADVIAAPLADDSLRLRLARNAQRHALAHDASAAAARVLSLYEDVRGSRVIQTPVALDAAERAAAIAPRSDASWSRTAAVPLVSVILPTFNRMKYLPAAVQSVLDQTFENWELIIVDDGSTDDTRRFVTSLHDERLRLICLDHTANPARVRNTGIRQARGRYVAFIDSDDAWTPRKLETQLVALRLSDTCRWSYTAVLIMDEAGAPIVIPRLRPWLPLDGWILEALIRTDASIATATVLVERQLLEEVGAFDETLLYCEDYDLWQRLATRSPVHVHAAPTARVRVHAARYTLDSVAMHEAWARLYRKTAELVTDPRLRSLCTARRLQHELSLSRIYSAQQQAPAAFRTLFRAFPYAWSYRKWWLSTARAMIRPFVPPPLRRIYRTLRHA